MIYKLTDKVWWGDFNAPQESKNEAKFIFCLAHNIGDNCDLNPFKLPWEIPYLKLAHPDEFICDDEFFDTLSRVIELIKIRQWFPLLTHCLAGKHRSPAMAIYISSYLDGFNKNSINEHKDRMRNLCPDFQYGNFAKSINDRLLRVAL